MEFVWGHSGRYNDFSRYFRRQFDGKVQKISVDGGFTCPNRDGSISRSGCSYCNNDTFNPDYCRSEKSISRQIEEGIRFFSAKYSNMRFLAYFQAYSGTYAAVPVLKERYREALGDQRVIGLVIATRPDCVNEEILDYLEELSQSCYLKIEFGLESVRDDTLRRINRGHTFSDSVRALEATAERKLHSCAHLILGLPGEHYPDFMEQAKVISTLPVESLKLHQLQIHHGTPMAAAYRRNPGSFHLFPVEEYLELTADYLELLNPSLVIERFVSQAPPAMVIAPNWGLKNFEFTARLEKLLKKRDSWQGKQYSI